MRLYQKLLDLQKQLYYFKKDTRGHGFNYVSGLEILSKVRPLMDKLNLILVQEAIDQQIYKMEKNDLKKPFITMVKFKFTWIDIETDEKLECFFGGQGNDNSDKGFGMACTYAERYFLLKFFHIPTDEDDPDNPNNNLNQFKNKKDDKNEKNIWKEKLLKEIDQKLKFENINESLLSKEYHDRIKKLKNNNDILKEEEYHLFVSYVMQEIKNFKGENNE